MMRRTPISLPTLVAVLMSIKFFIFEANGRLLTCSSPCQQPDASGASGIALPPCVISTTSCGTDENLPVNQAPGSPDHAGMESSSYIATDAKTYLDVAPYWQASPDRINLLTGYEVRVRCNQNICATQSFCIRILFNRTLTVNDTQSNFSVTCQYGDFAQPGMEYVTIISSLPKSSQNSNEARFKTVLPTCQQVTQVSTCESPEDWIPSDRPTISQIANGSVMVTFWRHSTYRLYDVMLMGEGEDPKYFSTKVDLGLENQGQQVIFDDVPEGIYTAYIMIDEVLCSDCPMITSENSITVRAIPPPAPSTTPLSSSTTPLAPSKTPPAASSTPVALFKPSTHLTNPEASLSLAALSGALGGILLVILIVIFLARTCRRSPVARSQSSGEKSKMEGDPMKLANNNSQCEECDSLEGIGYAKQWPLSTIYSDDRDCKFISPSLVPPTIHHENLTNERLRQESQFYADSMAFHGRGDSVSKIAVDIHSGTHHQTSSKCDQPESPDSGLELIFSEGTVYDGQTQFSLALTSYGDAV